MIIPSSYPSEAIRACVTALVMSVAIMPVLIWATRKLFGRCTWYEGFLWGSTIAGPWAVHVIQPLTDAWLK
jgi:hypothetical protein